MSVTAAQWSSIEIGTDNTYLTDAEIHYEFSALEGQSLSVLSNSPAPAYTDVSPDVWYAEAVAGRRHCADLALYGGMVLLGRKPEQYHLFAVSSNASN